MEFKVTAPENSIVKGIITYTDTTTWDSSPRLDYVIINIPFKTDWDIVNYFGCKEKYVERMQEIIDIDWPNEKLKETPVKGWQPDSKTGIITINWILWGIVPMASPYPFSILDDKGFEVWKKETLERQQFEEEERVMKNL
jgi:hypothetical protein